MLRAVFSVLCIAFAGAHTLHGDNRVTRAASAQVDAAGKVLLMPEDVDAMGQAQNSQSEVIRGTVTPKLEEAATLAQIKPLATGNPSLPQIKESITDAIIQYLQIPKPNAQPDAVQILHDMEAHLEPLKLYSQTHGEPKAADVVDTGRLMKFIADQGATKDQKQAMSVLFGMEQLFNQNGLSLAQFSDDDSDDDPQGWNDSPEKKTIDKVTDAVKRIGVAVKGGDIGPTLAKISVASTLCPPCSPVIVYAGMSVMMYNVVTHFPLGSVKEDPM